MRRPDDRLGLGHDRLGGAVVDVQRGQVDPVEADPLEALGPRLGEPVPGLGPVPDDRQAARGAARQQHLPLRVGQLLRLVDDDVRERPGEQVGVGARHGILVDERRRQVLAAQHRHHPHLGVVGRDEVGDDVGHPLAVGGLGGLPPGPATGRLRVAEASPGRVEQRQVRHGPGARVLALQREQLVALEPRRAPPQVGRHRPQVADEVGRLDQRPGPAEGLDELLVGGERAAEPLVRVRSGQAVGVERRRRHGVSAPTASPASPSSTSSAACRRGWRAAPPTRCRGSRCARPPAPGRRTPRPSRRGQPDVAPGRVDLQALRRRLLVEPHRRLDGVDHARVGLEPGHLRVGLGRRWLPRARGRAACRSARPPRRGWAARRQT